MKYSASFEIRRSSTQSDGKIRFDRFPATLRRTQKRLADPIPLGAIKEKAASVLAAMGLTVSGAVRQLLTKEEQDKALPFEPLIPNAAAIPAMKAANLEMLLHDLNTDD